MPAIPTVSCTSESAQREALLSRTRCDTYACTTVDAQRLAINPRGCSDVRAVQMSLGPPANTRRRDGEHSELCEVGGSLLLLPPRRASRLTIMEYGIRGVFRPARVNTRTPAQVAYIVPATLRAPASKRILSLARLCQACGFFGAIG